MTQNIGVLGGNCSLHFRVKDFFTPLLLRLLAHCDFWVCLGPSGVEGGPEKGRAWPSRISDVIEGTRGCHQLILAAYWTERGIGQQKREGKGGRKGGGNKEAEGKGEEHGILSGWKVDTVPTARTVVANDLVLCWLCLLGFVCLGSPRKTAFCDFFSWHQHGHFCLPCPCFWRCSRRDRENDTRSVMEN